MNRSLEKGTCRLNGFLTPLAALLVLTAVLIPTAAGQDYHLEETKIVASDGDVVDLFGQAVSISGKVALVGAYGDDDSGNSSGSAYIYRHDPILGTWLEEAKLLASDGDVDDWFGLDVAISGDVAVVGAYRNDDNGFLTGSAYVYRYDPSSGTWPEETKLLASDLMDHDKFGDAVSVCDDLILIGAPGNDDNGSESGSAYLFRYNPGSGTWTEEAKLLPSDGAADDVFGYSVAVSGDAALVGAVGDDDNGSYSGSAYVFRYNPAGGSWTEETKILASDGVADDDFAWVVDLDDDVAVIGAFQDDDLGTDSGSAYIFRDDPGSTAWIEEAKLNSSDGTTNDRFGMNVSVDNEIVVVGAEYDKDRGFNSGSAYVFRYDTGSSAWKEVAKLLSSDGVAEDGFSSGVSVSDGNFIIGASKDDDLGRSSGAAYIFDHPFFTLTVSPKPLVGGQYATFSAMNGDPNSYTFLVCSYAGLMKTYVPYINKSLDLANPILWGIRLSDSQGNAKGQKRISLMPWGTYVWLQAAQFEKVSNVVLTQVQ